MSVTSAHATPVTLTLAQLDSFEILSSTSGFGGKNTSGVGHPWVKFTQIFSADESSEVTAGITGQNLDWTAYDELILGIANANENTWNIMLSVMDGDGLTSSSALVAEPADVAPLTVGDFSQFSVSLAGLNTADIDDIWITVGAITPLSGGDYTAEFAAAPVPEPGTILLLGTGLVGLAFANSRRKKA